MRRTISNSKAYQLTTHWGSYMDSWDPGACMYGFSVGDARVQSEAHRQQLLDYIQEMLDHPVNKHGNTMLVSHRRELIALRNWFRHCSVKL